MSAEYVEPRNGGYYLKGTRVPLDSIVYSVKDGESPETIRQNFPSLTLEQVYGAITFYLWQKAREYLAKPQGAYGSGLTMI